MNQQNKIKICEIFESIQGEGKYAGIPMLFIRTSGCTRACWFCDTKYHNQSRPMAVDVLIKEINKSKLKYVCWTGGEPLMWRTQIRQIIARETQGKENHLETNVDLLIEGDFYLFNYLAMSPKDKNQAEKIKDMIVSSSVLQSKDWDIKVVTDFKKEGKELIPYATMLMPLTTDNIKENKLIEQKVWQYCTKHNLRYSPRLHVEVWGIKKRRI